MLTPCTGAHSLISNYLGLYATGASPPHLHLYPHHPTNFFVHDTVLVVYDYILTLPLEIEAIWKAERFTGATVLFFLTRYFSLLLWAVETIETLVASQSYTVSVISDFSECGITYLI